MKLLLNKKHIMITIQDRIETLKIIFFANGVKCDSEQFLIEDINNLIKEVEEETRKEYQEALIWCSGSQDFQVEGKAREGWEKICLPLLKSITNKETKK